MRRLKHGHLNLTKIQNGRVIKCFDGHDLKERYNTECFVLEFLTGKLPVPKVLEHDDTRLILQTEFIDANHAADLNDTTKIEALHFTCGQHLKAIHEIPRESAAKQLAGKGSVFVHGDYNINNILLSKEDGSIIGIIDWEKAHLGEAINDLCWYEWIFRQSHPDKVQTLQHFYEGYGDNIEWERRKAGMIYLLDRASNRAKEKNDPDGITYWRQHCDTVAVYTKDSNAVSD
ncbi:MAG: phosphotransferase family protein [Opitutaceae bacterium]